MTLRTDLDDLHYSLLHEASIDGPDLILDGERYEGMYAAGDAWVAIAVKAPTWIRDLLEENVRLRHAMKELIDSHWSHHCSDGVGTCVAVSWEKFCDVWDVLHPDNPSSTDERLLPDAD